MNLGLRLSTPHPCKVLGQAQVDVSMILNEEYFPKWLLDMNPT